MNYSDLITMVVLVVVPAVAAWWWIQKTNARNGAAKRDTTK